MKQAETVWNGGFRCPFSGCSTSFVLQTAAAIATHFRRVHSEKDLDAAEIARCVAASTDKKPIKRCPRCNQFYGGGSETSHITRGTDGCPIVVVAPNTRSVSHSSSISSNPRDNGFDSP